MLVTAWPVAANAEHWWNPYWKCRRTVMAVPKDAAKPKYPGGNNCYVEFWTGGYLAKDAADLRVIAGKEELPFKVLSLGEDDRCQVVFRMLPKVTSYELYYGNEKAKPVESKWEPERGLLLETRRYRGGGFQNWQQMEKALERSKEFVLGRKFVPNVFIGYNPFGPSVNFISIFRGRLFVPSGGRYYIATTSDDASFVFVDGRMVVQWPGTHRAVPRAKHFAPVNLTQGMHQFAYYHVQAIDQCCAVAAWLPPWLQNGVPPKNPKQEIEWLKRQKFQVIPEANFPPVVHGVLAGLKIRGEMLTPDLAIKTIGQVLVDDHPFIKVRFVDITRAEGLRTIGSSWEFGDGCRATGKKVEHIYMAPGTYKVKLAVATAARQYETVQTVKIGQYWEAQTSETTDTAQAYADIASRYDFNAMDADSLMGAALLFRFVEKPKETLAICRRIVFNLENASTDALYNAAKAIGEVSEEAGGSPDLILNAYKKVLPKLKDKDKQAEIGVLTGLAYLNLMHKPDEAIKQFKDTLTQCASAAPLVLRKAYVGLGDAYRLKAKFEEAMDMYTKAQEIPVSDKPFRQAAVRIGAFARAIEGYLKAGDLKAAEEFIGAWEWEYPTEKLVGRSSLFKARVLIARKDFAGAVKQLEMLVAANPKSFYAPEALMMAAECYLKLRDKPKAVNALQTVVNDYRDSTLVEDAQKKLKELQEAK